MFYDDFLPPFFFFDDDPGLAAGAPDPGLEGRWSPGLGSLAKHSR